MIFIDFLFARFVVFLNLKFKPKKKSSLLIDEDETFRFINYFLKKAWKFVNCFKCKFKMMQKMRENLF